MNDMPLEATSALQFLLSCGQ